MSRFIKRALYLLVPAAAVGALAAPGVAFAQSVPCNAQPVCTNGNTAVTVSATVPSTITLTGLSAAISFGTTPAGVMTQALPNPAEAYAVSTNDASGYTLLLATAASMTSGTHTIPNSALTVIENDESGAPSFALGTSPVTLDTQAAAGSHNYAEIWQITPPAATVPGTYTETLTYEAIGN